MKIAGCRHNCSNRCPFPHSENVPFSFAEAWLDARYQFESLGREYAPDLSAGMTEARDFDNSSVVEISSFRHSSAEIRSVFAAEGFELVTCIEPCFGEAERHIFGVRERTSVRAVVPATCNLHMSFQDAW